jgi:hypothetical protein
MLEEGCLHDQARLTCPGARTTGPASKALIGISGFGVSKYEMTGDSYPSNSRLPI